jgi:hypothetical protein
MDDNESSFIQVSGYIQVTSISSDSKFVRALESAQWSISSLYPSLIMLDIHRWKRFDQPFFPLTGMMNDPRKLPHNEP